MPRVLVVTYYWPPSGGSGVQRWLKFVKYLPEFGWTPTVIAPAGADYPTVDESLAADVPPGVEVVRLPIREPYALYRRLTGAGPGDVKAPASAERPGLLKRLAIWVRANYFVPDPRVWWVRPTVKRLLERLKDHPADVVVTTGPPHSVHLIGLALKRANPTCAWVMDIRDPWSQFDVHLAFDPGARARARNRRLERSCLDAADVVLATSPSMPTHLEPFDTSKFRCVTNGYDAADFQVDASHSPQTATGDSRERPPAFRIYHTGLLGADRNPEALWRALAELCATDSGFAERLKIELIGTVDSVVKQSLAQHRELDNKWRVTPWLAHAELIRHYREADVLLLCPNRSDNARGQINGKVFEYLAARRPVLHVGPYDADNTRLLDEAHAGLTVAPDDEVGMRDAVWRLYSQPYASDGRAFRDDVIARYERRATAARLAAVLAGAQQSTGAPGS